jgi:N-acetylglutamate synthase
MDNPAALTEKQLRLTAQLEASLLRVWPSIDLEMMDGWAVRAAMGYSGRANSASALQPNARLDDAKLKQISAFFTIRNLPTIVRVSPLCADGIVANLKSKGFTSRGIAHTMTAHLLPDALQIHPASKLETTASQTWLYGDTSLQTDPAKRNPEALQAIVSRIQVPVCFCTIQSEGQDTGFGLVAIDNGWAEISSIIVDPAHTGKGLGRALVTSLLAWARQRGAANAYLQVDVTNHVAINLYRSLGFTVLYDYDTLRRDIT